MNWLQTGARCANTRGLIIAFACGMTAVVSLASVPHAQAQTFYVATNGNDTSGDGSMGNPWGTIRGALASLHDGNIDDATVLVRPGDYFGRQSLVGTFTNGVTVRSEIPYQARLRHSSQTVVAYENSRGASNIAFEGFDIAHTGAGASPLVFHIDGAGGNQGIGNITVRNNVIHDSYNNDLLKINNGVTDVIVEGNMFYNQTGSDEHIDINSVEDVVVRDNVFFNDFAGSGRTNTNSTSSFIVIKDSNDDDDQFVGNDRVTVQRNVFLNWEGSTGGNFVLIGEDAKPFIEARNVMVENNLMLGNSAEVMRAAFGVKSGENITFRNNTVVGDLPALAYAMRVNVENPSVTNDEINFYNNIWSDPTGTMGAGLGAPNDFSDSPAGQVDQWELENNLYFNGGADIPANTNETINYTDDTRRIIDDPQLPTQGNLVVPRWDANSAAFADGSSSIREAFVNLVTNYGTPAVTGAGVDQAWAAQSPIDDILGNLRGSSPDVGALELPTTPSADLDQDGDVDGFDFMLIQRTDPSLIPTWVAAYGSGQVTASITSASVPEPTNLALAMLVLLIFGAYSPTHRVY